MYIHTYIHTCIYIYMYIYMYKRIYIYRHKQTYFRCIGTLQSTQGKNQDQLTRIRTLKGQLQIDLEQSREAIAELLMEQQVCSCDSSCTCIRLHILVCNLNSANMRTLKSTRYNMCMYVCMYVCMYLCMSVCLYVCMYVCMYMHAHAHRYISSGRLRVFC